MGFRARNGRLLFAGSLRPCPATAQGRQRAASGCALCGHPLVALVATPPSPHSHSFCCSLASHQRWLCPPLCFSLQLSAIDVSARTTMKGAANCDKHCELQNSVNQQILERKLHFRDIPESMPASVSNHFLPATRTARLSRSCGFLSFWCLCVLGVACSLRGRLWPLTHLKHGKSFRLHTAS